MINAAIFSRLSGDGTLTGLVPAAKIFSGKAENNAAAPYLVMQRISTDRVRSLSGPSGFATARFQFDAYADDYDSAKAIADRVRQLLAGYSGTSGGETIKQASVTDEQDIVDAETPAVLHRVRVDVLVVYLES